MANTFYMINGLIFREGQKLTPYIAAEYIDADLVPRRQVFALLISIEIKLFENKIFRFFCRSSSHHKNSFPGGSSAALVFYTVKIPIGLPFVLHISGIVTCYLVHDMIILSRKGGDTVGRKATKTPEERTAAATTYKNLRFSH